jgi:type II secretory pathway predicted ATPase ExeA
MPTPPTAATTKLRALAERSERVFASYPLVARYFPAAAIEDARQRLIRTIERGEGPGLVIGAPGSGKSLLLQVLATQYHDKFDVVLLGAARFCTRRALLQAMLFELGLPYKLRDEGDLRLSLLDHLLSKDCPAGLLLLVDEAQTLPVALLDELRVLTNLVRAGVPRVRLILAGSASLEEAFANPELESFSQRLSARCYLAALNREETSQYMRAQIAASGGSPDDVLAADAATVVFEATDGVPRLVNQLCDRALQFAVKNGRPQIDRPTIQEAWADLQQLPTPWDTPVIEEVSADEAPVIEFGRLNEVTTGPVLTPSVTLDIDDTELDNEDIEIAADHAAFAQASGAAPNAADPFAESFEEEEVVLDNFAAWDDMFGRETPRVNNRRDPGFSSLVQAAIDASPVSPNKFSVSELVAEAAPSDDSSLAWPRLRLAEIADHSHADSPGPAATTPTAPTPAAAFNSDSLASVLSAFAIGSSSEHVEDAESPVILIEDEAVRNTSTPAVRREDYRNLFSRLRSG